MKKLLKLLFVSLLFCAAGSCSDSDDITVKYLDVTHANIAGYWKLSSWNGAAQTDDPYMYIVFNRRESTFEIYQNLDSGKSRYITGVYEIIAKDGEQTVIKGYYDHGSGLWAHDYYVGKLTENEMTWTITDNPNDVSVYTRSDGIPQNIMDGTRGW